MANLVTMAGRGKRFSEAGYILPKPLIPIDGDPMIWKVIDCLPESDTWIFVVRQEHIDEFHIHKAIKEKIPNAIITVDKDLLGGASIFCAEQYIKDDDEVFIAGCDMGFVYDENKYESLKKDPKYDCILWTFTKDQRISANPKAWGYAVLDHDGKTIKDMSVKVPISDNPFNDHVVAATFWIRSKKILYDGIRKMMSDNIKTNNEYYLDNLPLALNLLGKKSCIFDVDLLVGWGTPQEFHEFEKISYFYKLGDLNKINMSKHEQALWNKYFENYS
ncbi:NTP transferase domain-containing protein [Candidatus Pacearchaeota archaeon]|nr:NTP transferase domain-containing protein [Candidatus Pacearchaeota archaeon]